jgi:hypothetical protein
MNPITPRTPNDRHRALARLNSLTVGRAVVGLAAVGGFGLLAANTYTGATTAGTAAWQGR